MIYYKSGYKYQLAKHHETQIRFRPKEPIRTEYISVDPDGYMQIRAGYAWDGPSGPTIDFKNFMRASLIHDATYQLIRDGYIPQSYREISDHELMENCIKDGMWTVKAWIVYYAVRLGGKWTSRPEDGRPLLSAP